MTVQHPRLPLRQPIRPAGPRAPKGGAAATTDLISHDHPEMGNAGIVNRLPSLTSPLRTERCPAPFLSEAGWSDAAPREALTGPAGSLGTMGSAPIGGRPSTYPFQCCLIVRQTDGRTEDPDFRSEECERRWAVRRIAAGYHHNLEEDIVAQAFSSPGQRHEDLIDNHDAA